MWSPKKSTRTPGAYRLAFSPFPSSVLFCGRGRAGMMDRQSATKQLPSTSCDDSVEQIENIGQKFSAEFIIIIVISYLMVLVNS